MVDAIEVINGGLSEGAQSKLDEIGVALSDRYATVGNSDSHHKASIGSVFTTFPGHTASDYLAALQARSTCPSRGEAVAMPRDARAFTRRRSMTRPGWVRNVYREVAGRPK